MEAPSRCSPRIAVLGAGHVGPVIARVAVEAGYDVSLAASGNPRDISLISEVLAPGAVARWAADAVQASDIVVLSIPLHRFSAFDPDLVAGKLVVDTMNYWPPTDGILGRFENAEEGSSEVVQRQLARSTVVKALNHIGYHELDDQRRPPGARTVAPSQWRATTGRRSRLWRELSTASAMTPSSSGA